MEIPASQLVIADLNEVNLISFYDCFCSLMREGYGQFPTQLQEYFLDHDYTLANFKVWIDRNFRKVILAINQENKVVGFLIGDHAYGGVCFISWFGLLKEYRLQGIGSQMLGKYIEYAHIRKAHLIELYTYNGASGFYEKHGFKLIGKREQGFFGQKNLIMNLKLRDFNINDII